MKRYKKPMGIVLVILLCSLLPINNLAYANSQSSEAKDPLSIDWVYANQISTSLYISSSGEATATGQLVGYSGVTTEVWIFLYLERYSNGSWTTVNSWYQSFNSYRGTLQKSTFVSAGYWYRVMASYYAYSGGDYEHIGEYSNSVYR